MHMADALISPAVAGTMYACSAAAAAYSIRKVKLEADPKSIPVMGVMGAFVFAAQMINFTIPGTGSSGHLCGGMMLTALLGPWNAFLAMIGVLLIQCLFFADGGLLALGCNIWNMAFYGCFLGYFLIWKPLTKNSLNKRRILAASVLGSVISLQLGAFSVTLETLASNITELPFQVFAATMQPIHLAIGLVEGLITAAVLLFVYETRPKLLAGSKTPDSQNRLTLGRILAAFCLLALLTGGLFSLFASSQPDGLEWSIQQVTGSTEIEAADTGTHQNAEQIQEGTSLLPDYGFQDSDSLLGTSFSGIAGSLAVLGICLGVCHLIRHLKRSRAEKA